MKLNKLIVSVAIFCSILMNDSYSLNAQVKSIYYVPEMGANFYKITNTSNSAKMSLGLRAGMNVMFRLSKDFFVAPGLFYSMKGFRVEDSYLNYKQVYGYIEVPVNLQYNITFKDNRAIIINAGPYFGYGINANHGSKFGSDGNLKAFDMGLNFGLGYKAPFGGYIRGQFQAGLQNIANHDYNTYKNVGLTLSLGYIL